MCVITPIFILFGFSSFTFLSSTKQEKGTPKYFKAFCSTAPLIMNEEIDKLQNLSVYQIELLQHQFREYKILKKRYAESNLAKRAERSLAKSKSSDDVPLVNIDINNPSVQQSIAVLKEPPPSALKSEKITVENESQKTAPLSWQCFNTMLYFGPSRPITEHAISLQSSVSIHAFVL